MDTVRHGVSSACPLIKPGPATAKPGAPAGRRRKTRHVRRSTTLTCLVANSGTWSGWPGRIDPLAVRRTWHGADERPPVAAPQPNDDNATTVAPEGVRQQVPEPDPPATSVPGERWGRAQEDGRCEPADPVVRDNLGDPVPIADAELDVVEIYLDQLLRDLLSPTAAPRNEDT
jgi:hypothetical protein